MHYSSAWDCEALLRGKINKNRILTRELGTTATAALLIIPLTADFAEREREREKERNRRRERKTESAR